MGEDASSASRERRLYGRGAGRALSQRRRVLVETLGDELRLPEGELGLSSLFPGADEVRLEIGFGAGEHLAGQVARTSHVGFIGAEFFMEGFAKALSRLAELNATAERVRVFRGDGRDVLDRLATSSLAMVYVLFPDPWPKARHHKRRLIEARTVAALARVLRPGGRLRVATDVQSYVDWALWSIRADGRFRWLAKCAADWRTPPGDHVTTRYERKNIGDCRPVFLDFVRVQD